MDDKDLKFFREKMQGIKRLVNKKVVHPQKKIVPKPLKKKIPKEENKYFSFADSLSELVTAETKLKFSRSGVQPKILRELRLGKLPQNHILDLHGRTMDESREDLSKFIAFCLDHHDRCVRIIHGKGRPGSEPVLKNYVNSWLQQHPAVLAFCSARSNEGGTGAVYVLLKKS